MERLSGRAAPALRWRDPRPQCHPERSAAARSRGTATNSAIAARRQARRLRRATKLDDCGGPSTSRCGATLGMTRTGSCRRREGLSASPAESRSCVKSAATARPQCHPERSAAARSRGTATKLGDCSAPPSSMIAARHQARRLQRAAKLDDYGGPSTSRCGATLGMTGQCRRAKDGAPLLREPLLREPLLR